MGRRASRAIPNAALSLKPRTDRIPRLRAGMTIPADDPVRRIAGGLVAAHPGELAFLADGDGVCFASAECRGPTSAVFDLVQGLRELPNAEARVRRRIWATSPERGLDRAVVQVVARRCTSAVHPLAGALEVEAREVGGLAEQARQRAATLATKVIDAVCEPVEVLRELEAHAHSEGPRHTWDRPLAAVLVDPGGRVLLGARNLAGGNRTLHAEVVLAQTWWARHGAFPAGSTVVCSLQSCRMCAACLVAAAGDGFAVRYLRADPGRLARCTALQALDLERLWLGGESVRR